MRLRAHEIRDADYVSPPLCFEEWTGLTGIHTPWIMPEGLSHADVEIGFIAVTAHACRNTGTIHKAYGAHLTGLFDYLCDINPELRKLAFVRGNTQATIDATIGITSQFNLNDLEYFLTTPVEVRSTDRERLSLADFIRGRIQDPYYEIYTGWVASLPTLQFIVQQMDRHPVYMGHYRQGAIPCDLTPSLIRPQIEKYNGVRKKIIAELAEAEDRVNLAITPAPHARSANNSGRQRPPARSSQYSAPGL